MDGYKLMVYGILYGVRDSILGLWALIFIDNEVRKFNPQHKSRSYRQEKHEYPRVKKRVFQCCLLNGAVFWLSIFLFNSVFLPLGQHLMTLLGGSGARIMWGYLSPILQVVFSALWVMPLFILSKVVNSLWFVDIADMVYRQSRGRPHAAASLSKVVADMFFSLLIQMFFLIQSVLVGFLPFIIVGDVVATVHLSLLYSLYAFEYRWFNMGWELHKRLGFIETNWPYFLGFGLPMAILTSIPNSQIIRVVRQISLWMVPSLRICKWHGKTIRNVIMTRLWRGKPKMHALFSLSSRQSKKLALEDIREYFYGNEEILVG